MADINDITTGALDGTGYFDKIMAALNVQIDSQFSKQRLQGKDFATVYLGALQAGLSSAIQYVSIVEQVNASTARTVSETALLDQKTKTEKAQIMDDLAYAGTEITGAIGKLKDLHTAQTSGFSRDAEQKASRILLDSWAISRSVVGSAFPVPAGALNTDIEDVLDKLRTGISITQSIFEGIADAGSGQIVGTTSFVQLSAKASTYRPNADGNPVPPSGFIWTKESGTTGITLDAPWTLGVETEDEIVTFESITADIIVLKLEALYANSFNTSSSFAYVIITVE